MFCVCCSRLRQVMIVDCSYLVLIFAMYGLRRAHILKMYFDLVVGLLISVILLARVLLARNYAMERCDLVDFPKFFLVV